MVDLKECLDNIIGLSDYTCDCIDTPPDGYDTSTSGLYMTDDELGVPLNQALFATSNCFGNDTVWEVLEKCRKKAVSDFVTEMKTGIYQEYNSKFSTFNTWIGKKKGNTLLDDTNFIGHRYQAKSPVKGAEICISKVCFFINCPDDINIKVYRESDLNNDLIAAVPVLEQIFTPVAGQWNEFDFQVNLPLLVNGCEEAYIIGYHLPDGCKAMKNKFICCGSKPGWLKHLKVCGVNGIDVNDLKQNSNCAYGLLVKASLTCQGLDWLCEFDEICEYDPKDVIGATILYKATRKLIGKIMKSGNISFYTLLSPEDLKFRYHAAEKSYHKNINWLIANIPEGATDCFQCKKSNLGRKFGIKI